MQAADLNNFSVTTVTTTGDVSVGGALSIAGGIAGSLGATTVSTLTATGTVTPEGLVDLSGAAAGQIKFPATQNASANANTLDDYEEGSWTPVIGGSGGTSGQTYTTQVGKYVKVGKLVTAYFRVLSSAKGTITNNAQIQGLPFTTENTAELKVGGVIAYWNNTVNSFVNLSIVADPNTTAATIYGATAAAAVPTALTTADINNATEFIGSITYAATA